MYVLVTGRVTVSPAGLAPGELGSGAAFGELAALDLRPRSAIVTAVTETTLLRVVHATVVVLMAEHLEIAHGIIRFLIRRYGRPAAAAPTTQREDPQP
jgi:voltage-gated potassium channel